MSKGHNKVKTWFRAAVAGGLPLRLACLLFGCIAGPQTVAAEDRIVPPVFIAHAGGEINGQAYTNSLEAFNFNYAKGFRFFEVDLSWTADDELVATHDWEVFIDTHAGASSGSIPTKAQFLKYKSTQGLTQLSFDDILKWDEEKGDAYVITDVKTDNLKAINRIPANLRGPNSIIIPQVYSFFEYDQAIALGFKNIILTLYKMRIDPVARLEFATVRKPFAVTMHWPLVRTGLARLLQRNNTVVYAHTVNDMETFLELQSLGVHGIYTDALFGVAAE